VLAFCDVTSDETPVGALTNGITWMMQDGVIA
jgi:hypothetical protein